MLKSPFVTGEAAHGTITITGGAATETITIKGINTSDTVMCVLKTSANAVTLNKQSISGDNSVLLTFSGDPGAGSVYYVVIKNTV